MVDVFHNTTKTVPKSDSRVVRIDLDKSDLGARKSHITGVAPKNNYGIQHVTNATIKGS